MCHVISALLHPKKSDCNWISARIMSKFESATRSSSASLDEESDLGSSSEDVTEDEHGFELTPALDAAILRTLGKIKRREGVYGSEDVLKEALREAETRAGVLKLNSRPEKQQIHKV